MRGFVYLIFSKIHHTIKITTKKNTLKSVLFILTGVIIQHTIIFNVHGPYLNRFCSLSYKIFKSSHITHNYD